MMIQRMLLYLVLSAITLAAAAPQPAVFNHPRQFAAGNDPNMGGIADFNHDGKPDLAVLSSTSGVAILLNNGNGFAAPVLYPAGDDAPGFMTVADLNQDGNADIVVVDGFASIHL